MATLLMDKKKHVINGSLSGTLIADKCQRLRSHLSARDKTLETKNFEPRNEIKPGR